MKVVQVKNVRFFKKSVYRRIKGIKLYVHILFLQSGKLAECSFEGEVGDIVIISHRHKIR